MSMSNAFENASALLEFNNTNIANVGDATGLRGSTSAGSLYLAFHTADPGEAGDQTTNEATYTGYSRTAQARTSGVFTVTGNTVTNAATMSGAQCTGGSAQDLTHWSLGVASSGASMILYSGPLAAAPKMFTGATNDDVTIPGNTLSVNDRVVVTAAPGGTLPTGVTDGSLYYVKTSSGNVITLSTTQGGATLDLTAAGAGLIAKAEVRTVSTGITPQFLASTLTITKD